MRYRKTVFTLYYLWHFPSLLWLSVISPFLTLWGLTVEIWRITDDDYRHKKIAELEANEMKASAK